MSKKSRKEIYIHMCNYSKSLKTTLQITDENIKIIDKTEELNNKVREALKYQRLRLFIFPLDPHIKNLRILRIFSQLLLFAFPLRGRKYSLLFLSQSDLIFLVPLE